MSKFSIPVTGSVVTDSQFLLNKLKAVFAGNKLPGNLLNALKDFIQSEEFNNIFAPKEKEKLQMIFAGIK